MRVSQGMGMRYFKEQWMERSGDRSELSRQQSPFVREGWLRIRDLPVKLADALLAGVSCRTVLPAVSVEQSQKPQTMKWYYILPAPVYGIIAAFLPIPAWINAFGMLCIAAISVCLACRFPAKPHTVEQGNTVSSTNTGKVAAIEIEESALNAALDWSEKMLKAEVDYLREIEAEVQKGHDVTGNERFGQWVQKFVVYVGRHEEDRNIQMLNNELRNVLDSMGIAVYDELLLDEAGVPLLPHQTYYTDEREGEAFTRVKRPVVYSERKLLAKGTLK